MNASDMLLFLTIQQRRHQRQYTTCNVQRATSTQHAAAGQSVYSDAQEECRKCTTRESSIDELRL